MCVSVFAAILLSLHPSSFLLACLEINSLLFSVRGRVRKVCTTHKHAFIHRILECACVSILTTYMLVCENEYTHTCMHVCVRVRVMASDCPLLHPHTHRWAGHRLTRPVPRLASGPAGGAGGCTHMRTASSSAGRSVMLNLSPPPLSFVARLSSLILVARWVRVYQHSVGL